MAEQLRASVLAEDSDLVPVYTQWFTTVGNSDS